MKTASALVAVLLILTACTEARGVKAQIKEDFHDAKTAIKDGFHETKAAVKEKLD